MNLAPSRAMPGQPASARFDSGEMARRGHIAYLGLVQSGQARISAGRNLQWEGFFNARDLGGLPTTRGRLTRFRSFIRSADLRFVTQAGWQMAYEAGVRTIIDLRNEDEIRPLSSGLQLTSQAGSATLPATQAAVVPASLVTTELPIDDVDDAVLWQYLNGERLNGTPLYFRPFLQRKPERCAAAITALARAKPGAIFHCGAGRDRTGLVALLLLALVGVEPQAIADDYVLSTEAVTGLFAAVGRNDDGPQIVAELARRGTTAREAVLATLAGFDARQYLLKAGVSRADLAAIESRLV
jgi:protein-tyrosine phosphatase